MAQLPPRTLADVASQLDELDDDDTIYAAHDPEWTATSRSVVARAPDDGSVPLVADGLGYFLEVYLAKEVIDVWREWR